jgi:hypothetical protein
MKPWMTRVIAVTLLAAGYAAQHALIPPGYKILGISVAGALTAALAFLTAVGISGPQLWPQLAAALGNGALKPPAAPPPPDKPAALLIPLAIVLGLSSSCYRGDPPWPGDPTSPPPVVTLPTPPGPTLPPYLRCTEFRVDISQDAGVRDDAGTWHYPATATSSPCPRRSS